MRCAASLLLVALAAGCTSLGESTEGLLVLNDLAPHEARVRLENTSDKPVQVSPQAFRLEGGDGKVFPGAPSARPGALGAVTLQPGERVEGWVAFDVQARAVAPVSLVFESDGLRLEARMTSVT